MSKYVLIAVAVVAVIFVVLFITNPPANHEELSPAAGVGSEGGEGGETAETVEGAESAEAVEEAPADLEEAPVPEPAAEESEVAEEIELPADVQRKGDFAVQAMDMQKRIDAMNAFYRKEDEVLLTMPTYEEVKDEAVTRAAALLEERGVSLSDAAAVIELAQGEIDSFWESGGLLEPASYDHAYVARAVLEQAVAQAGDDFRLLTALKEAISTPTPSYLVDHRGEPRRLYEEVWPILERQKALIESGAVAPSAEALDAMMDWTIVRQYREGGPQEAVAGWQWLVDNGQAGGWASLAPQFQKALEMAKEGQSLGMNIYCYTFPEGASGDPGEVNAVFLSNARRLPSFKGSPKHRANLKPVWEQATVHYSSVRSKTVTEPDGTTRTVYEEVE